MATATVDVGTGTTVAFGTATTFSPKLRSIKLGAETVSVIDISHMGTTAYREKMHGDLKEPLTVTLEADYNPSLTVPLGNVAETVTITLPIPAGGSSGATIVGTAFLSSASDADVPLEDKMTATYVIQFDGFTGPTYTAAT
jgi:hypothetical protein